MSAWSELDNKTGGSSSGEGKVEFTNFPQGVTRIRALDKEPHVRWIHWMNQFKRSANCPGRGCPICNIIKNQRANKETPTYNSQQKFAITIYNYDTERVELLDQGKTFFQDLRDLKEDNGGDVTSFDIRVRRRGLGKEDTTYRLDVENDDSLSLPEGLESIDLAEFFKEHTVEQITKLLNGSTWEEAIVGTPNQEDEGSDEEVVLK